MGEGLRRAVAAAKATQAWGKVMGAVEAEVRDEAASCPVHPDVVRLAAWRAFQALPVEQHVDLIEAAVEELRGSR